MLWLAIFALLLVLIWPFVPRRRSAQRRVEGNFYRSPEWAAVQRKVEAENRRWYGRPTCERCRARPDHWWPWKRRRMHTDHIKPRSLRPDLALSVSNGQELCDHCNRVKSNRCSINWRRLRRLHLHPVAFVLVWYQRLVLGWRA